MKKFRKTTAVLLSALIMLICITPTLAENRLIGVYLDNKLVEFDITNGKQDQALTIYDYAYVPIARIVEILTGSRPYWNDNAKTSSFSYNGKSYVIDTKQNGIYVNNVFVQSVTGTPPVIVNDRMMIPLKMLSSTMGFSQSYNAASHTTWLTSPVVTTPAATPSPTPTSTPVTTGQAVINSASLSKADITANEAIELTIKTNSATNYVWVNYDGDNSAATFRSTDSSGKTWTVTCYPSKSQTMMVYANTSQLSTGAVLKNVAVTVSAASPAINSISLNKNTINQGDSVSLTIKSNSTANYVWVSYDNTSSAATYQSTDSSGVKTWTVSISPSKSQTMTVYANKDKQTTSGAVSKTQSITVENSVKINSVSASKTTVAAGDSITITAKTNSAANYVWADNSIENIEFSYTGTDSSGYKVWTMTYYPNKTYDVKVYASVSRWGTDVSNSIYITVQEGSPKITSAYAYPGTTYVLEKGPEVNTFTVTTNSAVKYVSVSVNGGDYVQDRPSTQSGDTLIWNISAEVWHDGRTTGTMYITITAYGSDGKYDRTTVPIVILS